MPPHQPLFLIASLHAVVVGSFALCLSLADLTAALAPLYGAQRAAAVSSGFAKDCFEGVQALILLFAFGYARLYFDGPERQPLMLCFGGVGKVGVAAWLTRVHCTIRACDPSPFPPALHLLGTLPDALLGLCFLREWRRLGYALCETKRM